MNTLNVKEEILRIYDHQDNIIREKFDRSLSFQDSLFDRFERAEKLGFGSGASIYNSALVYGQVSVGAKTWVGPNVILDGSGDGIKIGTFCSIAAGVHIYTHDTVLWALSGGESELKKAGVIVGDNTYIGPQSIIIAGVHIGTCCLIGANSFVNRNVNDNEIVVGSPARVIGRVEKIGDQIILKYFKNPK